MVLNFGREDAIGTIIIISMGIVRLADFLKTKFPHLIKHRFPPQYRHRVLAVDASSTIYSFLAKTITFSQNRVNTPMDAHGNQTGHLIGLLYRVLLCKQAQIDTVWVFDGKPPQHKFDQLYRRKQLKEEALAKSESARDVGDIEEAVRQSKRTIYVSSSEREDAKTLLQLMGLPVIQAPSEGEAQCAHLAKNKYVEGVIGEDIDTLVFGSPILVRNFNRGGEATELCLSEILQALQMSYEQFIDFCILCGCDYTSKIPNVGPIKAHSYIKAHKNIENIIQTLNNSESFRKKYQIPDDFNYLIARKLFLKPVVKDCTAEQMAPKPFQEQKVRQFLLERDFDEKRVENWIAKVKEFDSKAGSLL